MKKIIEEIYRNLNENNPDIIKVKKLVDQLASGEGSRDSIFGNNNESKRLMRMYNTLASNIPGSNVFVFDRDLNVMHAHGREMEKYGYSADHFEGNNLRDMWSSQEKKIYEPLYISTIKGRRLEEEVWFDDEVFNICLIPIRNDSGSVIAGLSIQMNNTSEQKREYELKKAKEKAEGADRMKSDFMANMSHEIRTPLNSIIGFTEQLGKTTLQKDQRNFLNQIADSSGHLLRVVNEILILMKIGSGSLYVEKRPFFIHNAFVQSLNKIRINAEKKGLDLKFSFSEDIPRVLIGDPMRFRQILINLLSNAVKFTQFGYVKAKLDVVKEEEGKINLRVRISDSGIGIDSEELDSIFQPFRQSDTSVTRKFGGSGLGLTIVKELIELQGGSIKVVSTKNKGTVFTVIIPFEIGQASDVEEDEANFEYNAGLLEGIHVLLVDDDETNRLLAKTILNSWKVAFEEAEDGFEALEKLGNNKYDLVLLDIHMPELSGLDVVGKIRGDKSNLNNKTKFVAVTANIVNRDLKTFENAGMDGYLIKPYREEALFNKISNILELKPEGGLRKYFEEGETQIDIDDDDEKPYDLSELINVSRGDTYFYNKTLQSFIDTAENICNSIQELKSKEDWKAIGEKAHKLISSSRFLGLTEIAHICVQIEDGTLNNKETNVPANVDLLLNKLLKVIKMLKNEYIRS